MVWNSCMTAKKWHQSTTLIWYDCLVYTEMMVLNTLLRHSIHYGGDHQRKKGMNAQSTLWWWTHMFYKNPFRSMKKVRVHVAIKKKRLDSLLLDFDLSFKGVCLDHMFGHPFMQERSPLTPVKLNGPISFWHNTNIDVVCGKQLRMSTPSRNQSSIMGDEDYFVWHERTKRCQRENEQQMQTLLRQTERLREENEELRAQISIVGPSQSQHT